MFEKLDEIVEQMTTIRRDIHAHPELAFQENRTAKIVAEHLKSLGFDEVHEGLAVTGVVGLLKGNRPGRRIGLRADMDALPLSENNQFDYKSKTEGKMHACGHDGHTAILLGAASVLAASREFEGEALFVFQPAEEGEGGAAKMIEEGLFKRWPCDAFFGVHNMPGVELDHYGVKSGPVSASSDDFEIIIQGMGGHAAWPEKAKNPIMVLSQLLAEVSKLQQRLQKEPEVAILTVTQAHAGTTFNIIPNQAIITGTARALSHDMRKKLEVELKASVARVSENTGFEIDVKYHKLYAPTINSERETNYCLAVADQVFGPQKVIREFPPMMGSEDFSAFLEVIPGAYGFVGNGPGVGGCHLHNPDYDFNDGALPSSITYFVELVRNFSQIESMASSAVK